MLSTHQHGRSKIFSRWFTPLPQQTTDERRDGRDEKTETRDKRREESETDSLSSVLRLLTPLLCLLLSAFCLLSSARAASLWSASTTPAVTSSTDNNPYELGVKFTSDVSGTIAGIRFYKGSGNTGTHVGHLWSSTGQLLASATFTNETASGWQQVNFAQPIAISANTVYVASYWDPSGHYAVNQSYFTSEYNNAPLHALADGAAGPNGIYSWNQSAFPTGTYGSSNYWVDVVFTPAPSQATLWSASTTPQNPSTSNGVPYELGVRFTSDVSGTITGVRFYKGSGNTGTHIAHLWSNSGQLLATATFTNETASGWQQVNFAQPVAITANTTYVASYWNPSGYFAVNRSYFTAEYNNPPLHALADGQAGSDGLYKPWVSGFPNAASQSSNYWVDVVFSPGSANSSNSGVTISSVSPATGPASGGTPVTITGSNFASGMTVSFGGANASSVTVVSSTQLTAVTPAGGGAVNVTVSDPDPSSASLPGGFMYVANPTITGVSPNSGPATGGTGVTISGAGFQSGAMVAFGAMLAASVTVMSPTQIQAITPAEPAGMVAITVTNPDNGKANLASGFAFETVGAQQPQITSATTDPGAAGSSASCVNQLPTGATQMCTVTITGKNFEPGATVQIDGVNATNVNVVNSKNITATVPTSSKTDQYVNITVTNAGGLSSTLGNGFFYGKIVFEDGFESGNFSNWNYIDHNGNGGLCVANSSGACVGKVPRSNLTACPDHTPVHSGSYVACQYYTLHAGTGNQDQDDYMEKHVAGMSHFFLRNFVYFPTVSSGTDDAQRKLQYINLNDQSGGSHWFNIVNTYNKQFALFPKSDDQPICYSQTFFSNNQWYEVESETKLNSTSPLTTDGYTNLWVDGTYQTLSGSSCSNRGASMYINDASTQLMTSFDVGEQVDTSGSAISEYRFIDDVVLADAYIP